MAIAEKSQVLCGSLSVQLQRSHRPVGSSPHRPPRRSPPGPDGNTMEFHGFPTDFVSCSESSGVAGKNLNFNQVQLKCHDPEIQVTVLNVKKHTKTTPSTCRTSKELSALMLAAVAIGKFEVKMIWALTVACHLALPKPLGSLRRDTEEMIILWMNIWLMVINGG